MGNDSGVVRNISFHNGIRTDSHVVPDMEWGQDSCSGSYKAVIADSPPSLDRYLLGNYAVSADFGLLADNNPVQSMKQNRRLGELCSLVDISGKRGIVIRIASFDVIEVVIFR